MKKLFLLISLIAVIISCNQKENSTVELADSTGLVKKDSSFYAIFRFDTTETWIFPSNYKPTDLNNKEIEEIQVLLNEYISIYNQNQRKEYEATQERFKDEALDVNKFLIDIRNYKQQFVPVLSPSGEKEVWVNCICSGATQDWKTEIINIQGGGNCFFNLKINLTQKKCYYLVVTGVS